MDFIFKTYTGTLLRSLSNPVAPLNMLHSMESKTRKTFFSLHHDRVWELGHSSANE